MFRRATIKLIKLSYILSEFCICILILRIYVTFVSINYSIIALCLKDIIYNRFLYFSYKLYLNVYVLVHVLCLNWVMRLVRSVESQKHNLVPLIRGLKLGALIK